MKTVYIKTLTETFQVTYEDEHTPASWDTYDDDGHVYTEHGFEKRDQQLREAIHHEYSEYQYHVDLQHLVRLENGEVIDGFTVINDGETIGLITKDLRDTLTFDDYHNHITVIFGNMSSFSFVLYKNRRYSCEKLKKLIKKQTQSYYPDSIIEQIANEIYEKIIL